MMHEMMKVIPKLDHGLRQIVLVAKRAQAGRAQQEISASLRFQPQPSRSQYPQKVPTRKNQNVALDRAHAANHTISPRSNLGWQLFRDGCQPGRLAWISPVRRPSYSP